jgi:hypothetical protein
MCSVGDALIYADQQTYVMELTGAFRDSEERA